MVATKIFPKLGNELYKELAEVEMMQETRQLVVKIRNRLAHRLKIRAMAQGLKQVAKLEGFQVEFATSK